MATFFRSQTDWTLGGIRKPPLGLLPHSDHPHRKGLAGQWLMNEGSGLHLNDHSKNGNIGIINGATWVPGNCESALNFNGSSDYVEIQNTLLLNPNLITIIAWIKGAATSSDDQICSKDQTSGGTNRVWQFRKNSSEKLEFIIFDTEGDNASEVGSTTIADSEWHQVVGTWDGTTIRVYVDGKEDAAGTSYAGSLQQGKTNSVFIGKAQTADPGYFCGYIDQVSIYNYALSDSMIQQLYRNPFLAWEPQKKYWVVAADGQSIVPIVMQQMNQFTGGSISL